MVAKLSFLQWSPTGCPAHSKITLALFLSFLPLTVFSQVNLTQLDGALSQVEISEMEMIGNIDSATFYLQKDENILKLSIKSEPIHVANICIAQNGTAMLYHASAALGKIQYNRIDKRWETKDEFQWEMRSEATTPEVIRQRQNYFEEFGWIATTTKMGNSGETEFYFDTTFFESGPIYMAAGLMLVSNPDQIVSFPEQNAGACSDHNLVAGSPETQYSFDYSSWLEITL